MEIFNSLNALDAIKIKNNKRILVIGGITLIILMLLTVSIRTGYLAHIYRSIAGNGTNWTLGELEARRLEGEKLSALKSQESLVAKEIRLSKAVKDMEESGLYTNQSYEQEAIDLAETYKETFNVYPKFYTDIPRIKESLNSTGSTDTKSITGEEPYNPEIGARSLPTTEGFGSDEFTGSATINYPISIPAIRGNAQVNIGLSYSSRKIDELRLNKFGFEDVDGYVYQDKKCKKWDSRSNTWVADEQCKRYWNDTIYTNTSGVSGLGWDLNTFGSITMDPERNDEFILSFNGTNVRIVPSREEGHENEYTTVPNTGIRIYRLDGGPQDEIQIGVWEVVDKGGTTYIFGTFDEDSPLYGVDHETIEFPENSANSYIAGWWYGHDENHTPFCSNNRISAWNLSKIIDVHGNKVEIEYEQERGYIFKDYHEGKGCQYTAAIRPKLVKYNNDPRHGDEYLSEVEYFYEENSTGEPWYRLSNYQKDTSPTKKERVYSNIPFNTKILSRIVTRSNGKNINEYKLFYTSSYQNPFFSFDCPKVDTDKMVQYCSDDQNGEGLVRQKLLIGIVKNYFPLTGGDTPVISERPYTFCYDSMNYKTKGICGEAIKDPNNSKLFVVKTKKYHIDGCDDNRTEHTDCNPTAKMDWNKRNINDHTPNDIYLTKANNGYGGTVTYLYKKVDQIGRICSNQAPWTTLDENWELKDYMRVCTGENDFFPDGAGLTRRTASDYYIVDKIIAENGFGKQKVTDYEYMGKSLAYTKKFGAARKNRDTGEMQSNLDGLQFLGYSGTRVKVYEPKSNDINSIKNFLSYSEKKTYLAIEGGPTPTGNNDTNQSSFIVDPRKGMVYETKILDQNGKVKDTHNNFYGHTVTEYLVTKRENDGRMVKVNNLDNLIEPNQKYWSVFRAHVKSNYANAEGRETKTESLYDFEADPNSKSNDGRVVRSTNMGNISTSRDDIYSYTRYLGPEDFGCDSEAEVESCQGYKRYYDKNLDGLVAETWSSDVKADTIDQIRQIPEQHRYGWSQNSYDDRLERWGVMPGIADVDNPVRGLVSETRSIYFGVSANMEGQSDNKKQISRSYTDYNMYGLPIRHISNTGLASQTYYDDIFGSFPICSVQFKKKTNVDEEFVKYDNNLCNQEDAREKKDRFISKYLFDVDGLLDKNSALARGLVSAIEGPNGERKEYAYDDMGRVTHTWGPDPTTYHKTTRDESKKNRNADAYAMYFDDTTPMATRIATRISYDDSKEDIWKYTDDIMDGFGNTLQEIKYDNHYENGTFLALNYNEFNGLGQVTKSHNGVKIATNDGWVSPIPTPIDLTRNVIDKGTITETTYDFYGRVNSTTTYPGDNPSLVKKTNGFRIGYLTYSRDNRNLYKVTKEDHFGRTKSITTYYCPPEKTLDGKPCNWDNNYGEIVTRFDYHPVLGVVTHVYEVNPKLRNRKVELSRKVYNTAGMTLYSLDSDRGATITKYDEYGRTVEVTDANGNKTVTTYDEISRPKEILAYDKTGNQKRDTLMEYDTDKLGSLYKTSLKVFGINDLLDRKQNNGTWLQETWTDTDNAGRTIASYSKSIDFTADGVADGTASDLSDPIIQRKKPTYTRTGTVVANSLSISSRLTKAKGLEWEIVDNVRYEFDDDGKLIRSYDPQTNKDYVSKVDYNYRGQSTKISHGNGIDVEFSYDDASRLTNRSVVKREDGSYYSNVDYYYEWINRGGTQTASDFIIAIQSNTNDLETNFFKYDSLGRLVGTVGDWNKKDLETDEDWMKASYSGKLLTVDVDKNKNVVGDKLLFDFYTSKYPKKTGTTKMTGLKADINAINREYYAKYSFDNSTGNLVYKEEISLTNDSAQSNAQNQAMYYRSNGTQNELLKIEDMTACSNDITQKEIGYDPTVNGCPYHALMSSSITTGNQEKRHIAYLYDKKGNMILEAYRSFDDELKKERTYEYTKYMYSVLDLPERVEKYSDKGELLQRITYVYGLGGQRLVKIVPEVKDIPDARIEIYEKDSRTGEIINPTHARGDEVKLNIPYENLSHSQLRNASIEVQLPEGIQFVGQHSSLGWSCKNEEEKFSPSMCKFKLGNVGYEERSSWPNTLYLLLSLKINPNLDTTVIDKEVRVQVKYTDDDKDKSPDNNKSSWTIQIDPTLAGQGNGDDNNEENSQNTVIVYAKAQKDPDKPEGAIMVVRYVPTDEKSTFQVDNTDNYKPYSAQFNTKSIEPGDIEVYFTNDYKKRDLFVDAIQIEGERYEAEDAWVIGTWIGGANGSCRNGGFHHRERLHCNGYFAQFGQSVQPTDNDDNNSGSSNTSDESTIAIRAKGTSAGGEYPKLAISINGKQTDTGCKVRDDFSICKVMTKKINESDDIKILFTNDAVINGKDRNVTIDYIEIDGKRIESENVDAKGSWIGNCGESTSEERRSYGPETLHCNGYFDYQ